MTRVCFSKGKGTANVGAWSETIADNDVKKMSNFVAIAFNWP